MSKGRLIIIAGWAHSADDLSDLSSRLDSRFDVQATSTAALFAGQGTNQQSDHPASRYAKALNAMIGKSRDPVIIVGWSMGAIVALESISLLAPGISRLVIISGTARFCSGSGFTPGIPEQNLRAMTAGLSGKPEQTLEHFFRDAMFPGTDADQLAGIKAKQAIRQGTDCLHDGLVYLRQTDLRDRLQGITVPTLIIHGEQDRIVPVSAGAFLHGRIANSLIAIHGKAGHTLILDHPAQIAEDISSFTEG